jgi:ABC-type transport system involved in Fe-S cluster assembly fused permease/ATPase subunit
MDIPPKQLVASFISTIAHMPARSRAICALIVYPAKSSSADLAAIKKQIQQEKITMAEFTDLPGLEKTVSDNTAAQTLTIPRPVICLISDQDFSQNAFDAVSPIVFRVDQSAHHLSHD